MWDGDGCGSLEQDCCEASGLPWFHKVLKSLTTEVLEMNICSDEGSSNGEDILIGSFEIFVKWACTFLVNWWS